MRLVLATEEMFEIGRRPMLLGSSEKCDVRVEGAAPEHARLDGDDIEAIAPCEVGEVPLLPGERRRLVAGCSVDLGKARVRVDTDETSTSADRFTTRELALRAVAEPKRLWPTVVVVQGVNVGLELVMREERTFQVGRGATSDLALEDVDVSRSHVELVRRGDAVLLCDQGSTRGTFLGRARLDPKRRAIWAPETMVRVGRTVLALLSPTWRGAGSGWQHAADGAPTGATTEAEPTAADESVPTNVETSPDAEHQGSNVPLDAVTGSAGAIAEVPRSERPAMNRRARALDWAFLVVLVAIVGLAVAGLVWVLWP